MSRQFFGAERFRGENEEEVELKYYLLSTEKFIDEVNEEKIFYGIEITKNEGELLNEFERSIINDVGLDRDNVRSILKKLKVNQVTPTHLYDVVENLI